MSFDMKYIDAERLKTFVQARRDMHFNHYVKSGVGCIAEYKYDEDVELLDLIYSLQQEQQDFPTTDEEIEMFLATHPKIEVPNKYKTPDWLWKQQEQPEVDLEKEIQEYIQKLGFGYGGWVDGLSDEDLKNIARYFYELGLKAGKEG